MRATALLAALLALPAAAQEAPVPVDCEAPKGIGEVLRCAEFALDEAEGAMDQAYRLALTRAEVLGEDWDRRGGTPGDVSIRDMIERSQEAWRAHADAHCAAVSLAAGAGADEDGIAAALALCLTHQAELRAAELALFGEPA
ncbi:lysozyme inhibitor LprI family protein [Jannaschia sp. W003]|uniref:lysozyme inhibitor LprI family protein n=1 Tax=Jannaschia sp. W003 TaxID=2867012 RepID=UPI0021A6F73D|nr:lysozyme inhibitor LprI family protein [Jannaschia sp. W003]UWQ20945.1 DUF1311 domain-containing protein [Jannaschia sp. W003]